MEVGTTHRPAARGEGAAGLERRGVVQLDATRWFSVERRSPGSGANTGRQSARYEHS